MDIFTKLKSAPDSLDDDAGYVAAAREGHRGAFDVLVRKHHRQLRTFVLRRVGPEAVDDVLQETWLACWKALPRFNARSSFKVWLFSIALNKAMDHYRARSRHALVALDEESTQGGASIEQLYAAAELKETVASLLSQLSSTHRQVLEMYYFDELTLKEIGGVLKRNLNTVKYQFYRAHALIAEGIDEQATLLCDGNEWWRNERS